MPSWAVRRDRTGRRTNERARPATSRVRAAHRSCRPRRDTRAGEAFNGRLPSASRRHPRCTAILAGFGAEIACTISRDSFMDFCDRRAIGLHEGEREARSTLVDGLARTSAQAGSESYRHERFRCAERAAGKDVRPSRRDRRIPEGLVARRAGRTKQPILFRIRPLPRGLRRPLRGKKHERG